MHDAQFADATRPARCVILKLALLDYSIGHEIILLKERNPLLLTGFETLDADVQRKAVIRAADVCSQTWAENSITHRNFVQRWKNNRAWRKWERAVKQLTEAEWRLSIADFQSYRVTGSSCPPLLSKGHPMHKDEGGRAQGSPILACVLSAVLSIYHDAAFDLPLGFAQWLYFSQAEGEGNCKVENALECQTRTEIDKHVADYQREQAEKKGAKCPA